MRRLQLALVDKFRGRNKMIGGSQFRVSNPKKSGESDNCSDCAALRNGIKSLRFECRDLRSCVSDLQSQLSTERATRLALEQRATQDAIKWKAERTQMLKELEVLRNQPKRSPVRSPVRDGGILQELQQQLDTLRRRLELCEKEKQREATHRQGAEAHAEEIKTLWVRDKGIWSAEKAALKAELDALRSKHDAHSANGDSLSAERDRLAKELETANKARALLEEQLAALRASSGEFDSERDGMLERVAALEVSGIEWWLTTRSHRLLS